MRSILSSWLGGGKKADGQTFTVYTREGCGCCEKAIAVLEKSRARHGFAIETVDVDSDPELVEAYGLEVPVVAVDGKVRFRGMVNPVLLERLLADRGRE